MMTDQIFEPFQSARMLRKIVPESQADNPIGEYWEIWIVETEQARAQVVVQVFAGVNESGDNGFDVFVQATSRNSRTATQDAIAEIINRHHTESAARGFATRR